MERFRDSPATVGPASMKDADATATSAAFMIRIMTPPVGKSVLTTETDRTRSVGIMLTDGQRPALTLFGEHLRHISKSLELEGVAARIEEEHRRLLTDLPLEANVGFDHELRAGFRE